MTRQYLRPHAAPQMSRIYRIPNWGTVIAVLSGVCAIVLRPSAGAAGNAGSWIFLNGMLGSASNLLPGIDQYRLPFIRIGRFDHAAFAGSYFIVAAAIWLSMFLLLYRALVLVPTEEFIGAVEANKRYGQPPYQDKHRALSSVALFVSALVLPLVFLGFNAGVPAPHPTTHALTDEALLAVRYGYIAMGCGRCSCQRPRVRLSFCEAIHFALASGRLPDPSTCCRRSCAIGMRARGRDRAMYSETIDTNTSTTPSPFKSKLARSPKRKIHLIS
jgi:hypothetical protein